MNSETLAASERVAKYVILEAMRAGSSFEMTSAIATGALRGYLSIAASQVYDGKISREQVIEIVSDILGSVASSLLPQVVDSMLVLREVKK
jgi:hypothetical protein